MGRRLKVGVDLDGVLCDFTGAARKILQLLYDRPTDSVVQMEWSLESLGITHEEERVMWNVIDKDHNWWERLYKLPQTHLVGKLCQENEVYFITNRKNGLGLPVEEQSKRWLTAKYSIEHPSVILANRKGLLCAGLGLDYFIDDRPMNIEHVRESIPTCKTVLLEHPYTADFQHPLRVKTFNEFANMVFEGAE